MESNALARLRRVAGKQTARLTHYGRKTGKPYEVTLGVTIAMPCSAFFRHPSSDDIFLDALTFFM